jgi:hypothetical protein
MSDTPIHLAPVTVDQLRFQYARRQKALEEGKTEIAKRCMLSVDHILDIRPRPIAVTSDGEALWPGTPDWVLEQAGAQPDGPAAIPHTGGGAAVLENPFTPEDIERWTKQARTELGMIPGKGPRDPNGDPNS